MVLGAWFFMSGLIWHHLNAVGSLDWILGLLLVALSVMASVNAVLDFVEMAYLSEYYHSDFMLAKYEAPTLDEVRPPRFRLPL